MATDLKTALSLDIRAAERITDTGVNAGASQLIHQLGVALELANGTSANQADRIWSDDIDVVSGSPEDLDLRGGITSALSGATLNLVEVVLIAIYHTGTTAGQTLTIGAGSNPITTIWGASGDAAVIGPGGLYVWFSPVDGAATTAATADILRLVASTGTVTARVVIVGRSA